MTGAAPPPVPEPAGFGTVAGVPELPPGFAATFESRILDAGEVRLHAVLGGAGPPLLLVPGWPQSWYAWRLLMPALAERFEVVAVDPRGVGLSDKPTAGYDTGTLAADLAAAMATLGHETFSLVGHDVGMWIGYALAADHRERLDRLVLVDAIIPGISEMPPTLCPRAVNERAWHFAFNRLGGLNEQLVAGREGPFFGFQFETKALRPGAVPDRAVAYYVETLARDPEALRCSFEIYRALDETIEQNQRRALQPLELPVLAVGGAAGAGEQIAATVRKVATDPGLAVVPECGHYPAEEAPEALAAILLEFLAEDRS